MNRCLPMILLFLGLLAMGIPGCTASVPDTTNPSSSTGEPATWPVTYPVHILYVREIVQTSNAGGPFVEIALRNSSQEPIVSLNVILKQSGGRDFPYDFRVCASTPMTPDQTVKVVRVLIGSSRGPGLFDEGMDISGAFQSGIPFGLMMIS